ncbi:MAG: cupin domain-containing protein [Metallosphaera sp.]|uniref:Cupin 2 domain-containing protein n=1 Tax=Metallosphaera cuprina (strain Ar-4) TaxID=1006006 RepID=F4G3F9_METCR|nr:cupin domain-containing protein [Metallosphaera cuprina]AEB95329.1 cupin 2 domain-containing protein [Metallosphaera cuprina Ar-4]
MEYYISNFSNVKKEEVKIKGSKGSFIQWLVTKDHGAHYAVRRFTLEPNGVIAPHVHKYQETVIILKGSTKVCVGREVKELHENDFIFIDSGVEHAFYNGMDPLEFICIIDYVDDMSIHPVDRSCI